MESLEVSAKTVEEAIKLALAKLGKERDEVLISILSEGSRGILGIGGEEARILVTPISAEEEEEQPEATDEEVVALGVEVLENLLRAMKIDAEVTVRSTVPDADGQSVPAVLDIHGDDLGILIGRRGETLSSLQFITNLIISRQLRRFARVGVDVESYRLRREESLKSLAQRMAERVRVTNQAVTLEAMPPHERRIIHMTLNEDPHVMTQSIGEDAERKVVIMPRK
ncbi:MAG: protein jag [Dehalococcoidales bacterium]|nr:protein jag [Dehalococcoidales bacterium]